MTYKIAVCAGHGGSNSTPGKRDPDGNYEWNYNDKVVRAFIAELSNYEGVEVRRMDDASGKKDVSLSVRTNAANAWGADVYISFHQNALAGKWGGHGGTETFYYKGSATGKRLAQLLQDATLKALGLRDRGLKTNQLHITSSTRMTSALVECGFMDSKTDIEKLRDDNALKDVGLHSAQAVAKYAGLKRKSLLKPSTKPVVSKVESVSTKSGDMDTNSIVDYLKSIGESSSFSNRSKLAKQYGISGYSGTAAQNLDLLEAMRKRAPKAKAVSKTKPKGDMKTNSLVDYLKSINIDSSFANRKRLAAKYGIKNYSGTASQNTKLLDKLR